MFFYWKIRCKLFHHLYLGAYISGTSLIGAPLIMTVYMVHVACEKLRDTLFVLWFWFEISYAIIEAYGNK
jgi:hypothetical protein